MHLVLEMMQSSYSHIASELYGISLPVLPHNIRKTWEAVIDIFLEGASMPPGKFMLNSH